VGNGSSDTRVKSARVPASPIRIVIVDDHELLRQGLRSLFEHQGGFEVIGEARDGLGAVAVASELRPDVVLMDVNMPHMDGIEATRRIKAGAPGVRVVALTMHDNARVKAAMEAAGASAFVTKGEDAQSLCDTVRQVHGL
jgi:DNA-binding NarL/FixJ family response regulator